MPRRVKEINIQHEQEAKTSIRALSKDMQHGHASFTRIKDMLEVTQHGLEEWTSSTHGHAA
jgi:hypothetical protein